MKVRYASEALLTMPGFYLENFFWGGGGGGALRPIRARRFCKECMERCNRPISDENALLSFGST